MDNDAWAIQVVDVGWLIVAPAQKRSFRVGRCQLGRMTDGWFLGISADLVNEGTKLFQNVFDCLDQAGTVADQAMAAPADHAICRTGDGEHVANLFHGVRRGGERPAYRGCLNDVYARLRRRGLWA